MKPISIVLGEAENSGNYGLVLVAGELSFSEGKVRRLYAAGEVSLSDTHVNRMGVAGEAGLTDVSFGKAGFAGEVCLYGHCTGENVKIVGDLRAEALSCTRIVCAVGKQVRMKSGENKNRFFWQGFVQAEIMEIHYPLETELDGTVKNILFTAPVTAKREIACERFYGLAPLEASEIYGDYIFLLAQAGVEAAEIAGGKVVIAPEFAPDKTFRRQFSPKTPQKSGQGMAIVGQIEGDEVFVAQTKADLVCGKNVSIGALAVVDRVEYTETLTVSEKAAVGEAVRV